MRDAIALTADIVTIVGVLALLAFLLNHSVTRRLGVWAGALRDPYGYGWRRRQRGGDAGGVPLWTAFSAR